jgi:starvation-inducible DNA-binding protein
MLERSPEHVEERMPAKSRSRAAVSSTTTAPFTLPGLSQDDGHEVAHLLQDRLHALNDLALTLKHVHWNVVGPHFVGVHTMLDPQIDGVRLMVDALAERMAMLGVAPNGLAGALVAERSWDDYSLGRADVSSHLGALDLVYVGVITSHREVMDKLEDLDPVTQDMIIGQLSELETYHWFVRAHLENAAGTLATQGAASEGQAARASSTRTARGGSGRKRASAR